MGGLGGCARLSRLYHNTLSDIRGSINIAGLIVHPGGFEALKISVMKQVET